MKSFRTYIYEFVQSAIALIIVIAFVVVMVWAVLNGLPPAREGDQGFFLLLGSLNTALGVVLQTYFRQRDARASDSPGFGQRASDVVRPSINDRRADDSTPTG